MAILNLDYFFYEKKIGFWIVDIVQEIGKKMSYRYEIKST